MEIGLVIIGSELLSGKRADEHQNQARKLFQQRGLDLDWVRYLNDEPELIISNLRETMARNALVFCFGGIGATPDDHTRQCAATAANVALKRHPDAAKLLIDRFADDAFPVRIQMADIPDGATLIPNPVNQISAFSLGNHHFLPGFPSMAWPMMEWVLERYHPNLRGVDSLKERLTLVFNVPENELVEEMKQLMIRYPSVSVSCLPHANDSRFQLELGLRGEEADVLQAELTLHQLLKQRGLSWGATN